MITRFETDEKIFGNMTKEIKGVDDGTPFNMKYVPSRAINGEYGIDVRYGIMSGMNPNNAIIALLQMRSDKLVSRDYVRREIPMELLANKHVRVIRQSVDYFHEQLNLVRFMPSLGWDHIPRQLQKRKFLALQVPLKQRENVSNLLN